MYIFTPGEKAYSAQMNANLAGLASGSEDDDNNSLSLFRSEAVSNFVASGCIWSGDSYGSNRNASMTSGVVYINGSRVVVTAVSARNFTASKDTYVYVGLDGTISYSEVSNNATSPSFPADSILLAIIVTGASTIANSLSINQGRITTTSNAYLPSALVTGWNGQVQNTIIDANGMRIRPTSANEKLVAAVSRAQATNTGAPGGTSVAWNGMPWFLFYAEPGKNYELSVFEPVFSGWSSSGVFVMEVYLSATPGAFTTRVNEYSDDLTTNTRGFSFVMPFNSGAYSGKTYLELKLRSSGWGGTLSINTDTTRTGTYKISKA